MQLLQFAVPLDALEAFDAVLPYVILVLVLVTMATRFLAHRTHVKQAEEDADSVSHYLPHWIAFGLLIVASFAFTVLEPHGGAVLSTLVLGTFITDFFEFEARRVEARNNMAIEPPKGSLVAATFVLLYAAYQSLFVYIEGYWSAIV
jgi:hypothetical protein